MERVRRILYYVCALDPMLTTDQKLARWADIAALAGVPVTLLTGVIGAWLFSNPWIGVVVGLGIWNLALSGLVALRRLRSSTSSEPPAESKPENAASRPTPTDTDSVQAEYVEIQDEIEQLRADKRTLKKELEEARSSTSADSRHRDLIKELEQLRDKSEGLERLLHNQEIRNQFQITKAVQHCEEERDALKKKVSRWENCYQFHELLNNRYEEGARRREHDYGLRPVHYWEKGTNELIVAALGMEKMREMLHHNFLDEDPGYANYGNDVREDDSEAQIRMALLLHRLRTLMVNVNSLTNSPELREDFDPQHWKKRFNLE